MKKLSIKPIVKPKFVLGILIFVFLSTTIFFYLLKEGEENLRVFTQKRLTITQKELRVEKGRSKILNIELDQKKRELKIAASQLQQEISARRRVEANLIETIEVKRNLEEEVKKLTRGPKAVELEKIVVRPLKDSVGEVIDVNKDHGFIVVGLGRKNNLEIGDILSVHRDDELIGKTKVEKVEEGICAAVILSDWQDVEFKKNDLVKLSMGDKLWE